MSVRGRKPMLPVLGTPVTIPSLTKINPNKNVPRDTPTQPRTQQSVGGHLPPETDSEEDEEPSFIEEAAQPENEGPEDVDEDDDNLSQKSDGTVCNETFNDPGTDCAMDEEDEPIAQSGKRKAEELEEKAEELEEMAKGAKKLRGLKLALKKLEQALEKYEALILDLEDKEPTAAEQQLLEDLGVEVNLAQKLADDLDTPFAKLQREVQTIVTNELQNYDKGRRGYGQLAAAIESRVKAELKLKSNKDPAKVEALQEKLEKARDVETTRLEKWNKAPEPNKTVLGGADEERKSQKAILEKRLNDELVGYPEGARGMGVVIKAIRSRVQAEFALEFKPKNTYLDEDGRRYEDAVKQVQKFRNEEQVAKAKFAADQERRAQQDRDQQEKAEAQKRNALSAEQQNMQSIVNQAKKRLEAAEEKFEKLEATIIALKNELELSRAKYEETYMSPEQREQAENERSLEPCKDDEEAIYKLRWVLTNAMDDFNAMVNAFQGKSGDDEQRNPKEDCYTNLYGKGEDATIAPKPIPKWMEEIQVILKTAKDDIDAAEKNDPVGWEVEENGEENGEGEGEEEEKENLYTLYKEQFDDPDGVNRKEEKEQEDINKSMIAADTRTVAMTVVVRNAKLNDEEKGQLIKLDAFERLPNFETLKFPEDITESFYAKMSERKRKINEYIKTMLMEKSEVLPQVEHIDWGTMKAYLQAVQMKKDHPNATEGSENYGINELKDVTIASVKEVNYTVEFQMGKDAGDDWEEGALKILEYLSSDDCVPYISDDKELVILSIEGDHPYTKEKKAQMQAQKKANADSEGAKAAAATTQL